MLDFETVDLGYNNPLVDKCDYIDHTMLDPTEHKDHVDLAIMQLNSRGLLGKLDKLKSLIQDVRKTQRVHVIALAETWLKQNNVNRVKLPGFQFIGSHRKGRKGGGVGILVAQNLEFRIRKDLMMDLPGFENLTIELKTTRDSIFVSTLYRPPDNNSKSFLKNYKRLLNKFTPTELSRLIICMDHNLDLVKYNIHPLTNDFLELNLEKQLLPTITKPTRVTRSTATLIDNIIVGRKFQTNYESKILVSDLSDHFPCLLNIHNTQLFKRKKSTVTTRGLNSIRLEEIRVKLNQIKWTEELDHKNTSEAFDRFHNILMNTLDEIAPYHTVTIANDKLRRDPWLSIGLLKSLKKQQLLYKQFLSNRTDTRIEQKYKVYRNKLKEILRRTREQYFRDKCKAYRQSTSKLWKLINKLSNKENDKTNLIEYLKIDNVEIYNGKVIAEELAKHFAHVGKNFAEKIPTSQNSISHYLSQIPLNPKSMFMDPTSNIEIRKLIMQLPNKDSSGYDNLSNRLLKQLADSILEPLTTIFNQSLNEGVFPQGMKEADVIPLFKAKEHYLVTNYRPISLLLTVSKLLEKIVYIRTYRFLNENGQFYQGQYGFRSGHSCQNAISELVGTVAKNMEEKRFTIGVFIDLSKAFDTLCHSILLDKMEKYGIRGNIWQWFRDYLKHRSLRVKCMNNSGKMEYSSYHELDYGTPQGSCLGPLLFIIFINDLPLSTEYCLSLLFADDTTLLHSHQNLEILKTQLEQDIHTLMDWFKANKLTLNLSKTEVVLFSAQSTSMDVTLNIGIHQLKLKNHVKFLGMWLDSKLNWRKHITTLLIKLKQNVNMLKLSNKFLDKYTKKQVYHAHIISHVLYGLLLWGNAVDETSLSKIQGIMDKCFTICTGLPPTIPNYTMEKMLTLRELIKLESLKLSYRLHHNLLPENLHRLLWTDSKDNSLKKTHQYNTRHRLLPALPKAQSKSYHQNFQFQCIKTYEGIPVEIKESRTLETFVRRIKKTFFDRDY